MTKIPVIAGVIRRRFLINFRIEPEVLSRFLPKPFVPKIVNGYAIAGICLIRLENIRPQISPIDCGLSSENAAHRFAVKWSNGEGVYVPRRDTDSLVSHIAGGRVFSSEHHLARFEIQKDKTEYSFCMKSKDNEVGISFEGKIVDELPRDSCFKNLAEASTFFEEGSLGYSDNPKSNSYDGLLLKTKSWNVRPFEIKAVASSYFDDRNRFPNGSIEFDHALIMENIEHEWHSVESLCC